MDANNWDLFAVVRGCSTAGVAAVPDSLASFILEPPPPMSKEEELGGGMSDLFGVPELAETPALCSRYDRLEELCKPYYIAEAQPQPQPLLEKQRELQKLLKPCCYDSLSPKASVLSCVPAGPRRLFQRQQRTRPPSQTPRSKTKKNQQKKVVCHVAADAVSSDLWAWRKYGQKPIKGSPYPRGYYRCSSSKGCQARKQVERSRADPAILIITYTAEHNHPVPTHRNSLAGSTRQKCPPPVSSSKKHSPCSPSAASDCGDQLLRRPNNPFSSNPQSPQATALGLSPTTPLPPIAEDELLRRPHRVDEEEREVDDVDDEEGEELITVGDMEMMGEEEMIFFGMEVLRGPSTSGGLASSTFMETGDQQFFRSPWLFSSDTAAAAGGT